MDKELENKLDDMMRMVANGFEEAKTELRAEILESKSSLQKSLRAEIHESKEEVLSAIQRTKLESLDRYATNERVDKHEVRIQKLESNIA